MANPAEAASASPGYRRLSRTEARPRSMVDRAWYLREASMDAQRFDAISRRLATGTSRRQVLRALAASVATGFGLQRGLGGAAQAAPSESADARFCPEFCGVLGSGEEMGRCVAECAQCEAAGRDICGFPVGSFSPPFCCPAGTSCLRGRLCCPVEQVCRITSSVVDCCVPGTRCVEVGDGRRNCVAVD